VARDIRALNAAGVARGIAGIIAAPIPTACRGAKSLADPRHLRYSRRRIDMCDAAAIHHRLMLPRRRAMLMRFPTNA